MRRFAALVAVFALAGGLSAAATAAPHGKKSVELKGSSISTFRVDVDSA